jgi:V8-like Glu-specific endopeptidase
LTASSLDPLISDLRSLIGNGEVDDAFERLLNYLPTNSSNPKLYDDLLTQSGRYQMARRRQLAGTVTAEAAAVEENLIRAWLTDFIGRLPAKIERQFTPVPAAAPLAKEGASIREAIPTDRLRTMSGEKILGINNLKQISWIERGIQVCKSVCRILTPNGLGSGFMVDGGMIMTNNHVIASREIAAESVVEFDYQQNGSGQLLPSFRYKLDPDRFHTNAGLDYTFVGLKEDPSKKALAWWGSLQLNPNADPVPTEHVSIVQHPNGGLKQIVLTANHVIATRPPLLHYTTDTMPGSSGSPVFNDTWHVIAIHHSAVDTTDTAQGYVNEGILMSAIKPDAGAFWPVEG